MHNTKDFSVSHTAQLARRKGKDRRSLEGTQPRELTQTGKKGYLIPYDIMLSRGKKKVGVWKK